MEDSKSKVTETVVQVAFEGTQTVLEIGPFGPGFMACITLTEYGAGTVLPAARELAHLLAAAPEMLDALQATLAHVAVPAAKRDTAWHAEGQRVHALARVAIAKSTGKVP